MNWQPIETAPLDGTKMLLCMLPEVGFGVVIGYYRDSPLWGPVWDWDDGHTVEAPAGATHWMPVPEPPTT